MKPSQYIRARIRVQRCPRLFAVRKHDFGALTFALAVQAEEQREALSHVHEIVLWHEADDHVRADLAVSPRLVGAGADEDVGLGVVEDVACVGLGDARGGFVEGWVEGDVGGKFDAVGFATCVQRDELQSWTADFDSANGVCEQFVVDPLEFFEAFAVACVGGVVDVRDLLYPWNMLKL